MPVDELLIVIPVSVAVALVGILAYVVKKKDRQRERIHRAHQPSPGRSRNPDDG
jgi:flagellar basal body-associated protein FliL